MARKSEKEAVLSEADDRKERAQANHVIALITNDAHFCRVIQDTLKNLKAAKEEFAEISLELVEPDGQHVKSRSFKGTLDRSFLVLAEKRCLWDLVNHMKQKGLDIPVLAILDGYRVKEIDEVFQIGYLFTRGVVKRQVADPEDLGLIARLIKDEFRRKKALQGHMAMKKVGWKVQVDDEDRAGRRLVSMFVDPVMREFVQRLTFTVASVQEKMPKRRFSTDAELSALIREIHSAENKAAAEEKALQQLARSADGQANAHAPRPQPILLEGETGTGKTVIAEWIHRSLRLTSGGARVPFERISVVNIGENLLEAELFGVIPGTFTDAAPRPGRLLLACGGVVFLDEIGDLTPEMQAKFLVYLDEMEFTPVGWPYSWKVYSPLYVIAATNRDLESAVAAGQFRRDLYHRFTHKLTVPPLRERKNDLRPLIDLVLQDPELNTGGWVTEISLTALTRLERYRFPGNFRELESILAGAVFRTIQAGRRCILEEDLQI